MDKLSFITTLKFIRGQLLSWILSAPKRKAFQLTEYEKIQDLKVSPDGISETSLYEKNGKYYVVKILYARRGTLDYEYTLNQASMYSVLGDIEYRQSSGDRVCFPKLVDLIDGTPIVLVREYIDGELLADAPLATQRGVLKECLVALQYATGKIAPMVKRQLPRRSNMLMLVTFPVYLGIALIRGAVTFRIALRATVLFFKLSSSLSWFRTNYTLMHRDLHPGNIIVNGTRISIIDTESTLLAENGSDMAMSFLSYYESDNVKANIDYLKSTLSPGDWRKFSLLSIFYMIQLIASDITTEDGFAKQTRDYFVILVDCIVPSLLG